MATGKSYFARNNYRFLTTDHAPRSQDGGGGAFELDESDIYNAAAAAQHRAVSPEVGRRAAAIRQGRKSTPAVGAAASSLPVNIPDWSKILKEEYRRTPRDDGVQQGYYDEYDDDDGGDGDVDGAGRVPPHEFLARQAARTRIGIASFSVHEGIGRTLKGRDLSRVRNAIWEKTGFQD